MSGKQPIAPGYRSISSTSGRIGVLAIDARNLTRPVSGIGRSIANVVEALSATGHQTHLVAPAPLDGDFAMLAALPGVHVRSDNVQSAVGRLAWGRSGLPRHVRQIAPDLVWAPAHRLTAQVARLAPTVLTIHDLVWKFAPETMLAHRRLGDRLLTARAVARATRIVAVSERTAADLAARFPRVGHRIATVPNIVAPRPAPAPAARLAALGVARPYCLFVGTVEPRKNLARAVEAFLALSDDVRGDMRFVIAGARGWLTDATDRALAGAKDKVRALGPVDEATLSRLYRDCAFLVMPSLYEGFGYPAIEAQQFGKRVLTSHGSPMADIGGETVVRVDPLASASIADGMARCIAADEGAARAKAVENAGRFRAECVLPRLLAVFEEACDGWRS